MSTALLFPGQGAQFVGMGQDLAERFPEVRDLFQEADDTLGFALSTLMYEGPEEELILTRNAQPAIFLHSLAVHRVVESRVGPIAMAGGHSLGEFSAWVSAGTLRFSDALRAIRLRGEAMYEAGQARPGAMAAVLGLDDEAVSAFCDACSQASGTDGIVVPANFNSDGQTVISGDRDAVTAALEGGRDAGAKRVLPLRVSGAFHSPLMAPAQEALATCLADIPFKTPVYPVVSNVTAQPVTDPNEARELLVRQMTAPVRWHASVASMIEHGVTDFWELGPGSVLTGLNRRNAPGLVSRALGTAAEVEAFLAQGES